ncbi:MAG: ABC transporter ATP-binding protein [Bradymonadales bacterium]|nr:MAG: ABC transporter ATP-binding protein [Bradymonadales bacterium]
MLEIKGLEKKFGSLHVLKGLDLEIPLGQITVIIGGSGTGKSVLLKHIVGLIKPDRGQVLLDKRDLNQLGGEALKRERMRFGLLFQDAALFDSMSVFENIAFPLREHRSDLAEAEVVELVKRKLLQVKLPGIEEKYPSELSGGMRKRVGLARATVLDPEIMLYDEPTTGLDPITTKAIDELIVQTQQDLDATSVIISHDIQSTLRIANRIAMLHDGKIVASGSPREFLESEHKVVRDFLTPALERIEINGS